MSGNSRVDIGFGEKPQASSRRYQEDDPFCIAVLGDFSGGSVRGTTQVAYGGQEPLLVDRDNFDQVLSRFAVELTLRWDDSESSPVHLRFSHLDDFLPDQLVRQIQDSFSQDGVPGPGVDAQAPPSGLGKTETVKADEPPVPKPEELVSADLLERTVAATEEREPEEGRARSVREDPLAQYVQKIVKPFTQEEVDIETSASTLRNEELADELRKILHHPRFQALEATWRSVFFLTQRLETSRRLKLFLVDVSKPELLEDLGLVEDLAKTRLYRVLVDQFSAEQPWAVILGDYIFEPTEKDLALLKALAKLSRCCGAPFVAGGSPRLLGCSSLVDTPYPGDWTRTVDPEFTQEWQSLRRSEEARFLGLTIPRFLLRLPYGKDTMPVESLDFEEMIGAPPHQNYLWGNAAFVCGCLLSQTFSRMGWALQPGVISELDGFPSHVYHDGLEWRSKPCAEVNLPQSAVDRIGDNGLMALRSVKGGDSVLLADFRSLAEGRKALAGPWNR